MSVVISVVAGIHFYFWFRLVRQTQPSPPVRAWLTVGCIALAAVLPLSFIVVRRLPLGGARVMAFAGFGWLGLMFLLLVALLTTELVRLALHLRARLGESGVIDTTRRTLISRWLATGAAAAAGALGAVAIAKARALEVQEVAVRLRRLPRAHDGMTIVQLTDLHVGPTIGRAFVEDVVRRTNALVPDIVAITGDLVDGSVEDLREAIAPLGDLRAHHGVFFVTGNHEYFSGAEAWITELQRIGLRVLRNERVAIGGEGGFDLAGIDDWSARRMRAAGHGPDLEKALAGRDAGRELVLLSHQPRSIAQAASLGVGLQLSGHTHGGQIWPFKYMVRLQQPYVAGLHRHGDAQIYVSPGTGYWGPPMRLGTRAEITRIVLRSEQTA